MKYLITLIACTVLFISSCKKDVIESNPPSKPISNYMPLTIGNYWVYDNYKVDALGNETKLNYTDSIYVQGDTVIRGETYYVISGTYKPFLDSLSSWIIRDSSGYLVDELGNIHFSSTNFTDTLNSNATVVNNDTIVFAFANMDSNPYTVSVPAGTFTTLDYVTTFIYPYEPPYPQRKFHKYNTEGVGTVLQTWGYVSSTDIVEKRLVRYQIQK